MTKKIKNKIFKVLYKFHIYGGLFSSAFFIIIGITSLKYNHPSLFKNDDFREETYYHPFSFTSDSTSLITAHAMDSLKIFGNLPWWLQGRDAENNFWFQVMRPGKQYRIVVLEKKNQLMVTERSMGVMQALAGMHVATAGNFNSFAFSVWKAYAHAAVIVGLLSLVLSLYFWLKKSRLKRWHWISTGSVFLISIFYILYIWLIG